MPVGDNTPYNVNRKIATFNDYCDNLPSEKEELDKIKRTTSKNDTEMKQVPGNRTHKFNRVTRKIDDLSPAEVNDKIDSIEELEESVINEAKEGSEGFLKWLKELKKDVDAEAMGSGSAWNHGREELMSEIYKKAKKLLKD